jgi:hypothetical protein
MTRRADSPSCANAPCTTRQRGEFSEALLDFASATDLHAWLEQQANGH